VQRALAPGRRPGKTESTTPLPAPEKAPTPKKKKHGTLDIASQGGKRASALGAEQQTIMADLEDQLNAWRGQARRGDWRPVGTLLKAKGSPYWLIDVENRSGKKRTLRRQPKAGGGWQWKFVSA
jgi:hypothetical protein